MKEKCVPMRTWSWGSYTVQEGVENASKIQMLRRCHEKERGEWRHGLLSTVDQQDVRNRTYIKRGPWKGTDGSDTL